MGELDAIQRASSPRTRESLARDLRRLGVAPGMTLLVHSSLSSLGWVCGGAVAVIQALMDAITPGGTLVMPAHSGDCSDPANWGNPPVPEAWWQPIRDTMPAFDPLRTPTRGMGRIADLFRSWPEVLRSSHPALSFAAWGAHAETIVACHSLNHSLGEQSPLARIYDLDGRILLLGVGYDSNTSFHLAEYRVPGPEHLVAGAPILEGGRRLWKSYTDIVFDVESFPAIGEAFERAGKVRVGKVGSAEARLFSQREAVDFAERWIGIRRAGGVPPDAGV